MDDASLAAVRPRLRDGFAHLYGPRLHSLLVVGSWARGDARPGSDLDVLRLTVLLAFRQAR